MINIYLQGILFAIMRGLDILTHYFDIYRNFGWAMIDFEVKLVPTSSYIYKFLQWVGTTQKGCINLHN